MINHINVQGSDFIGYSIPVNSSNGIITIDTGIVRYNYTNYILSGYEYTIEQKDIDQQITGEIFIQNNQASLSLFCETKEDFIDQFSPRGCRLVGTLFIAKIKANTKAVHELHITTVSPAPIYEPTQDMVMMSGNNIYRPDQDQEVLLRQKDAKRKKRLQSEVELYKRNPIDVSRGLDNKTRDALLLRIGRTLELIKE